MQKSCNYEEARHWSCFWAHCLYQCLHHHSKEKNVVHLQIQKTWMKIPNAYYWYSTSLEIGLQAARNVEEKWLSLASWLEKKRWCNNKNLYKQKQQQTFETTKFCENFENFEKWTWQAKNGETGVTHRDNTNEDGMVASIVMNVNDLESFVVSANWNANICFKRKLQVKNK